MNAARAGEADKARVRLIGLPTDVHSSFLRGPASAPPAIRAALASDHSNLACEAGFELAADIVVEDAGDLPLHEDAGDDAIIRAAVADAIAAAAVPIALGGDHAVSFPLVEAVAAAHGPLNVLHIDAHPDLYDDFGGDPRSHASPFARILEGSHARRLIQVGIRTLNAHCRAQAERFGVEIVPMRGFMPADVPVLDAPLYISIDLDGFDPAFAPGVSHHEPGGLSVREVLDILDRQTARVVGADIVELNPARDRDGVTATLAAKLVKELAGLIARNGA
ncbi:agmatinase [Allosphingosinicella indica]|uniref:Agmatinase n=1 Tax=Allosphingosinicella indica TaxID=941907 RepID=A0A1X7GY65_9SPHN|nr:agmatinase [Allosphingosinicella indica]SMF76326.1 agmatinase [Allosphingosinicella indica]